MLAKELGGAPTRRGMSRGDRAAALVAERELDLLLVSNLVNVRYLSGFTGTNGVCLIGDGARIFITDFRYVERAKYEVPTSSWCGESRTCSSRSRRSSGNRRVTARELASTTRT